MLLSDRQENQEGSDLFVSQLADTFPGLGDLTTVWFADDTLLKVVHSHFPEAEKIADWYVSNLLHGYVIMSVLLHCDLVYAGCA
jgi:hypothetical protein